MSHLKLKWVNWLIILLLISSLTTYYTTKKELNIAYASQGPKAKSVRCILLDQ